YHGDALSVFRDWADSLSARGIKKISGNIVILDTLFQAEGFGPGWCWDDLAYDYSAKRTSFLFRENRASMLIMGTEDGKPPVIIMDPVADGMEIDRVEFHADMNRKSGGRGQVLTFNDLNSNPSPSRYAKKGTIIINDAITDKNATRNSIQIVPVGNGYRIMGVMKPDDKDEEYVALYNPEMTSANILKMMLADKGIKCSGKVRVIHSLAELKSPQVQLLFMHESPPLSKIIRLTNKQSVNVAAEALLLSLGRDAKNSVRTLKDSLEVMGIPRDSICIVDGSGLSRYNLCTAEQCSDLLEGMCDRPEFLTYIASLAIAGKDGSLLKRMKDSPATDRVFAKTGSMRFVRNLCGYALNQKNTLLAFSIMINGYPSEKEMTELEDKICDLLAGSGF
ncbi:MAG TPA: D-alanyl-D-alanine carboxypeptidase/D-alanyl-D-alanine-endopeptidase, partial [Candidatus Cloacimonadota bacterium]|nr:D-alanyl-D-alanine carboxypeptidase/D-alanyl-D-alanine-endopeptidase [Candidatus Cloacimonadota bacterium]